MLKSHLFQKHCFIECFLEIEHPSVNLVCSFKSTVNALVGAVIAFLIARNLGRPALEKLLKKNLQFCDDCLTERLTLWVFLLRLFPFFQFDIVSYGAGLRAIYTSDQKFGNIKYGTIGEIEWTSRGGWDGGDSNLGKKDKKEPHTTNYLDISIGQKLGDKFFFKNFS